MQEKKQAETAVKSLQTMCRNLAIQKTQLTTERTELQSQLSEGKITLDEYNRKKEDTIANEQKHMDKLNELIRIAGDESLSTDTRKEAMLKLNMN